jgi:hypothetical protein
MSQKPPSTIEGQYLRDAEMTGDLTRFTYGDNTVVRIEDTARLREEAAARVARRMEEDGQRRRNARADRAEKAITFAGKGGKLSDLPKAIGPDPEIAAAAELAEARDLVAVLDTAIGGLREVLTQEMYNAEGQARYTKVMEDIVFFSPKPSDRWADIETRRLQGEAVRGRVEAALVQCAVQAGATKEEERALRKALREAISIEDVPTLASIRSARKAAEQASTMTVKGHAFASAISQGTAQAVEHQGAAEERARSQAATKDKLDSLLDEVEAEIAETSVEETEDALV